MGVERSPQAEVVVEREFDEGERGAESCELVVCTGPAGADLGIKKLGTERA